MKDKFYSDYNEIELLNGYNSMLKELDAIDSKNVDKIVELFNEAWTKFCNNEWSYDGATFVRERYETTIFEIAAFLHDYRNSCGYVSYKIDVEMFNVMIILDYKITDIVKRYIMTRLTFVNIIRHKYFTKRYINKLPTNYITL